VPPRWVNSRGRGTEDQGFSALATITRLGDRGFLASGRGRGACDQGGKKMTGTVLIPAAGVGDVREALLCVLGDPLQALSHALTVPERELHPEWFLEDRHEFERMCGLLDLLGWDGAAPARAVELAGEHTGMVRRAVEDYLPLVEQWLAEAKLQRLRQGHRQSVQAMWSLLQELPSEHAPSEPEQIHHEDRDHETGA
jgi:hypothetical protein